MNSIVYIFCCLFSFNIIHVTPASLGPVTSPIKRSRVVAFDIDDTLCTRPDYFRDELEQLNIVRKNHPECPIICFTDTSCVLNTTYTYVFLPYLHILFDYLLKEDVRIVFFSAADKRRNLQVIAELLTSFWGTVKFETLKAKGQFDILSLENMREGNKSFRSGEGNYVKDLKAVIRDGETLLDVILVEDDASFVAYDQKPFLRVYNLAFWEIREVNHTEMAKDEDPVSFWRRKSPHFPLNNVYYMLGVFKTYFENERCKKLPFREALNETLPEKGYFYDFFHEHSFVYDMFDLGLSEVQKRVPNATFYGLRHPHVGSYKSKSGRYF
ncbi:uncharacterized protein LOC135843534 [Planococcus citri]|uniref:uncharacterized protein LOC135843534 n=1 Tax=Planococcus citri TaxID=170843 RepID=UPI0031F83402